MLLLNLQITLQLSSNADMCEPNYCIILRFCRFGTHARYVSGETSRSRNTVDARELTAQAHVLDYSSGESPRLMLTV